MHKDSFPTRSGRPGWLVRAGWPPVFVYMYDEVWRAIDAIWDLMARFLGDDCVLEPSFFAWCVAPHGTSPHARMLALKRKYERRPIRNGQCRARNPMTNPSES